MADERGSRAFSGFSAAVFAAALAVLVSSQLALMSVLDAERADAAAEQIATSRFTADVVAQTVERAVSPIAGPEIAVRLAAATSTDPQVIGVIDSALTTAHRTLVDPDGPAPTDGNVAVRAAITAAVLREANAAGVVPAAAGVDIGAVDALGLSSVAQQAGLPSVVPADVPAWGVRQVAEVGRILAAIAAFVFGFVAVIAHPRPGLGLRRLGVTVMIVCGAWLAGLLATGWIIGLVADTLFGEMLQTVWNDAVPSMLLLVGAGVVIGAGVVVAGIAADGWARERQRRPW